jgi:putative Holliday junction resolvase
LVTGRQREKLARDHTNVAGIPRRARCHGRGNPSATCYNARAMRALALDVGSKTIGLALSDPDQTIASAWDVLQRQGHLEDARRIVARVLDRQVAHIVVGLPLELDGRRGRRARAVDRFLEVLVPELEGLGGAVEVVKWDERYSTAAAERTLLEADLSRGKRKAKIDAMAAQFILDGWLEARRQRAAREES